MELYPLYVITPARTLFISGLKFRVLKLAEFAWQLSRYLRRGSVNFKINSRPLFTVIFKLKNDNFKTRDFSPLIERVLAGVEKVWLPDFKVKAWQGMNF